MYLSFFNVIYKNTDKTNALYESVHKHSLYQKCQGDSLESFWLLKTSLCQLVQYNAFLFAIPQLIFFFDTLPTFTVFAPVRF
ncbi:hypothetical protein SAMN06297164_0141 [Nitrosomonas ureae]|uniref:Uncharacterized protein n=1 Tax=Nitrosomonas ureae TaxID=44577 RepID=A0A286A1Z5_9PROT|nr:hypothetical protein SAMN06297164_0141 [Nitrosomonas ureae]